MKSKPFALFRLILALVAAIFVSWAPHAHAQCYPIRDGLVSWWRGQSNAWDIVGGNHGQLLGDTHYAQAEVRTGFVFDGDRDAVRVTRTNGLQLQTFTIETWIKRTDTNRVTFDPTEAAILVGFGANGYALGIYNDGRVFLTKVGIDIVESSLAITDTNFHHIAVTKQNDSVLFYIDGIVNPAPPLQSRLRLFNCPNHRRLFRPGQQFPGNHRRTGYFQLRSFSRPNRRHLSGRPRGQVPLAHHLRASPKPNGQSR